jgi:hypothetical protein
MPATQYDFNIEQGSSFKISLIYKDKDKNIIDLTNWCARLIMKTSNNATLVFDTTNLDYSVYKFSIDGPNGKMTLIIPADTTNGWLFKKAKYDLELQSPDEIYSGGGNYTTRLLYGNINIVKRFSLSSNSMSC